LTLPIEPTRIFLLSPASCHGRRAQLLMRAAASFPLALRVRNGGAPLSEVFTFLSGLYFRGKVEYARAFARPPAGVAPALVITSSRGLVPLDDTVTLRDLQEFAHVPIDNASPVYRSALERTATELAGRLDADSIIVLLGSVATGKYVDTLLATFGRRLRFPAEFVGRGDMSRGGLMLRCADDARELEYVPIEGRTRRGSRPPRLPPRPPSRRPT
jgi:hypothetical protein